jgi:hypothetical protein
VVAGGALAYWDKFTVGVARAAANGTERVKKQGTCKSPNRFYLISFLVGLNKSDAELNWLLNWILILLLTLGLIVFFDFGFI